MGKLSLMMCKYGSGQSQLWSIWQYTFGLDLKKIKKIIKDSVKISR
jgi:hypothetical protein